MARGRPVILVQDDAWDTRFRVEHLHDDRSNAADLMNRGLAEFMKRKPYRGSVDPRGFRVYIGRIREIWIPEAYDRTLENGGLWEVQPVHHDTELPHLR